MMKAVSRRLESFPAEETSNSTDDGVDWEVRGDRRGSGAEIVYETLTESSDSSKSSKYSRSSQKMAGSRKDRASGNPFASIPGAFRMEGWVFSGWRRLKLYLRLHGTILTAHDSPSGPASDLINVYESKISMSPVTRRVVIKPRTGKQIAFSVEAKRDLDAQGWFTMLSAVSQMRFSQRYEVMGKIADGAFGSVKLVRRLADGHTAAVKVTDTSKLDKRTMKLMENEVKVLASIQSANSVELEEVYMYKGMIYIVTEYLGGGSLEELTERVGIVDEATARLFMQGLLKAVFQLHDKNIVHRDIKLENIMLVSQEVTDGLKLIDYGFSALLVHSLNDGEEKGKPKQLSDVLGTWDYLAPEILKKKPYGAAIDMWACGVCLYKLLTGDIPLTPATTGPDAIRGSQMDARALELRKKAPNSLLNLIDGLLEIDPAKRITAWEAHMHPWLRESGCTFRIGTGSRRLTSVYEQRRRSIKAHYDGAPVQQRTRSFNETVETEDVDEEIDQDGESILNTRTRHLESFPIETGANGYWEDPLDDNDSGSDSAVFQTPRDSGLESRNGSRNKNNLAGRTPSGSTPNGGRRSLSFIYDRTITVSSALFKGGKGSRRESLRSNRRDSARSNTSSRKR